MYENCVFTELEDGSLLLEDVLTPYGTAECIYLGSGGIYIIVSVSDEPLAMYEYFRNLLSVARVRLYFVDKGEYLPSSDSFSGEIASEELHDVIYGYLHKPPQQFTKTMIERIKTTLIKSDASARGYYTDENGAVYLFRYGEFRRASEINPDRVFKLCLYGGVFGFHRFALGKWFTGLMYVLTCGFFLLGWIFDLAQFFFGSPKDKHKRFILPLTDRVSKTRQIPVGVLLNLVLFMFWLNAFYMTTDPASSFLMFNPSSFSSFLHNLF